MEYNLEKIIFIGYQPLTEKVAEDFFMLNFQSENFNVEYWDLSQIYFPKIQFENSCNKIIEKKIHKISEIKELIKEQNLNKTLFFINFTFNWRVVSLFLIISKYRITKAIVVRGMIPLPKQENKYVNFIRKINFKLIRSNLFSVIGLVLKKINVIKPYDYIFFTGQESLKIIGLGYLIDINHAKLFSINSSDYDKSMSEKNDSKLIDIEYVVFLDEYLPFHPDFEMFNTPTIEPQKYFLKLNEFFEKLEKKYGIEVVIAAHPKALKYTKHDFFQGRKIFYGKTMDLVKNSKYVIAHMSTSIGYSVIYNKECLLIYSEEIKNNMTFHYEMIKCFSNELDLKMVNIDEKNEQIYFQNHINIERYNDYRYNYLTNKEHEKKDSFSLVKNYLKIKDGENI